MIGGVRFVAALLLVSCSSPRVDSGGDTDCKRDLDCPQDWQCIDGHCAKPCNAASECPTEIEDCVSGFCVPVAEPVCSRDSECTVAAQCELALGARCQAGRCLYDVKSRGTPCDDDDLCTVDDICDGFGLCVASPRVCDEPPTHECIGANTIFRVYENSGACNAATGGCEYPHEDTDCAGCATNPTCGLVNCGNGELDPPFEECDEGVANDDGLSNACRIDCRLPWCGDGVTDSDEQCDDGNTSNLDACVVCVVAACGDGQRRTDLVTPDHPDYEQCDDGNFIDGDGCDENCTDTACGNGIVTNGEDCDDGNEANNDACIDCVPAVCGDGFLRVDITNPSNPAYEACDDGDTNDDNDCRNDCTWKLCGNDDPTDPGEACDTGAALSDTEPDACRSDCQWYRCGDNVVDSGESCDDGDSIAENACTDLCEPAACGDGVARADLDPSDVDFEECDDDNLTDGDGCDSNCTFTGCGNEIVTAGEDCDDGSLNSDTVPDACRADCADYGCGDEVVDTGEQCDTGALRSDVDPDACRIDCTNFGCGDGVIDTGETCDDGDEIDSANGCDALCQRNDDCGNGDIQSLFEECDDGVDNDDTTPNACRTNCLVAYCGDSVIDSGEQCDDGNTNDADGCSALCVNEVWVNEYCTLLRPDNDWIELALIEEALGTSPVRRFSVSLWFRTYAIPGPWDALFGATSNWFWEDGFGIYFYEGELYFYVNDYFRNEASTPFTVDGLWHHVIAVYNADLASEQIKLYVDGTLAATADYSGDVLLPTAPLEVGRMSAEGEGSNNPNLYNYVGFMDELGIWDRPLSGVEVSTLYNGGAPVDLATDISDQYTSSSSLVGYWRLGDGDDGVIFHDVTGNNHGTGHNIAPFRLQTTVPGL